MKSLLWKIGGEAGFGIMTTGLDFAKMAASLGYHTADYAEYPSLVRGGYNTYEVHFSKDKIYSSKKNIDILVCLNKETYDQCEDRLTENSRVIYDGEAFDVARDDIKKISVPFKKIINEEKAGSIMINTIALGASCAALDWPVDLYLQLLKKTFQDKGDDVVNMNVKLATSGYDHVCKTFAEHIIKDTEKAETNEPSVILTGNDAFALGSVIADCGLYCAYPMTPSSGVLSSLASWAEKTGMVVRHAEDEISVIMTALGGSFGGVRSGVGTSGGGFALMVESLSFAGVAELPIVIFIAQRPGPATGMPTWTEQGDLLFSAYAGHGEFPKIILAPGDIEEMYQCTTEAYDLADTYQTPVIVLSDKHLSESHWSVSKIALKLFAKIYEPKRGKRISSYEDDYMRYKVTEDGISPMLIPGTKDHFYQANSYEHSEDSHTTESHQERIKQVNKRSNKEKTYLKNDFKRPQYYGDKNADIVFVAWGGTKGTLIDSVRLLEEEEIHTGLLHFTHVYPLDESVREVFPEGKRYILVENNSTGQFGKLLRLYTGIDIKEKLLRYDGRQLFTDDVVNFMKQSA